MSILTIKMTCFRVEENLHYDLNAPPRHEFTSFFQASEIPFQISDSVIVRTPNRDFNVGESYSFKIGEISK